MPSPLTKIRFLASRPVRVCSCRSGQIAATNKKGKHSFRYLYHYIKMKAFEVKDSPSTACRSPCVFRSRLRHRWLIRRVRFDSHRTGCGAEPRTLVAHQNVVELFYPSGRLIFLVFPTNDDKVAFLTLLRQQIAEVAALPEHAQGASFAPRFLRLFGACPTIRS